MTSIPHSLSTPNYCEMSPTEQQDMGFLYSQITPWTFGARVINVLKSERGVYITDLSLRYALLACSAFGQGNSQRREIYRSMFWPSIRRVTRSNVNVGHLFAITLMLRSMLACLSQEDYRYLQNVANIISDIAKGIIAINLLPWGLDFDFLLASIHSVETVIPTNNLQSLASSKFEQWEISLPQLCRLCNPGSRHGQYGNDVAPLLFYAEEIRYAFVLVTNSTSDQKYPANRLVKLWGYFCGAHRKD
jgi:hypothetical protein